MGFKSSGSIEYDMLFEDLKDNYLQYYPFVGENYKKAKEKILIVGESHYAENTKESEEIHKHQNLTRAVINDKGINRDYRKTKTFTNFHKAIFTNDTFDSQKFWDLLAFYNFVQRPMFSSKHRPIFKDFTDGWQTFFKVIEIIKPTSIIFIGVKASDFLQNAISTSEYSLQNYKWDEKISRTYPRKGTLVSKENISTQVLFMQHSGRHFSHAKWNNYLQKHLGQKLDWLKQNVESTTYNNGYKT
jgi:hypothetical protein